LNVVERLQAENHVLAEIAGLATSSYQYAEVGQAALDLIQQVVSSPYLSLSLRAAGQIRRFELIDPDADPEWAEEAGEYVRELHQPRPAPASCAPTLLPASVPTWIVAFTAQLRSGRQAGLTLASPLPITVEPDEERMMTRLARQTLLVLDHALLLDQIERQETVDELTGVASQQRLLELLEYEIQRHQHFERRLTLLLLDVEGLEGINRQYGRQYGNHILQKIAGLLRDEVRPVDVLARYGHDEFAVMLPETDEETGQELAERLRARFLQVEFAGGAVGVSVGMACVRPDERLMPESILRRSEQALYAAKRTEREWQALFPPEVKRGRVPVSRGRVALEAAVQAGHLDSKESR
jgi:diguanylate cyclase (GGDEF)-like protein